MLFVKHLQKTCVSAGAEGGGSSVIKTRPKAGVGIVMKCQVSSLGGLKKKITVHVPYGQVTEAFQDQYRKWRLKVKMPGFRKGKVPLQQIQGAYGKEIQKDTLEDLMSRFYFKALKEEDLHPAGQPAFDCKSLPEEGKEFSFSVTLEVRPLISVDKNFKARLVKPSLQVTEKEVDQNLYQLRNSMARTETVMEKRPLKTGDVAQCEITTEQGAKKTHTIEITEQKSPLIRGLQEGLCGMQVGEQKTLPVTFSSSSLSEGKKEKTSHWKVKLLSIQKKVLPEVNEEFLKKFQCSDLNVLRQALKMSLQKNKEDQAYESMKTEALNQLVKSHPVEALPEGLIAQQMKAITDHHTRHLKNLHQSDKDIEEYKKKNMDNFKKQAQKEVHLSYLLFTLAEELKLEARPHEIKNFMEKNSQSHDPEAARQEAKNIILSQKVIKHLIDRADVRDSVSKV